MESQIQRERAVRVFAKREKFVIFAWERVIWNVKVVNASLTSKTASIFYLFIHLHTASF